ncbi:MAG: YgfZ/GcvT domain-containing protein [Actinomycetota bacterium]
MEVLVSDRSARGKLRLHGEQDLWFLHQILTHSFEDMEIGDAREAALLTAHGRMVAYLEALRTADGVLVHFEEDLIDVLPEALRRYVFATRVEIDDVGSEMGLVLVVGEGWPDLVADAAPAALAQPTHGYGVPAAYLWIPAAATAETLEALVGAGGLPATEEELERVRVENAVARWGKEMDQKTIPQEAGIDRYAVHFTKGCYVGQEAMAKIHFRGKVNRRLARLEGEGLVEGADVISGEQKVGTVTSVSDGRALAIVRYTIEPGDTVSVNEKEARVTA